MEIGTVVPIFKEKSMGILREDVLAGTNILSDDR
jgi:hypothetical protein